MTLIDADLAAKLVAAVPPHLLDDHVAADATLVAAWAEAADGSRTVTF